MADRPIARPFFGPLMTEAVNDPAGVVDKTINRAREQLVWWLEFGESLTRPGNSPMAVPQAYPQVWAQIWFARRAELLAEQSARDSAKAANDAVAVADRGVRISRTSLVVNAIIGSAAVLVAVTALFH